MILDIASQSDRQALSLIGSRPGERPGDAAVVSITAGALLLPLATLALRATWRMRSEAEAFAGNGGSDASRGCRPLMHLWRHREWNSPSPLPAPQEGCTTEVRSAPTSARAVPPTCLLQKRTHVRIRRCVLTSVAHQALEGVHAEMVVLCSAAMAVECFMPSLK